MPRIKKNQSEPQDCSKRSVTSFQTYVGQLVQKKQDKIKLMIARALMNEDMLEDFHGQVHANECVFSYPDSNWYGVYLVDESGKKYFGNNGARKFYFQLQIQTNDEQIPIDAFPMNGTFETPKELIVNGEEINGCVIKPSGKCGNPVSKKKKKTVNVEQYESDEEESTPQQVLKELSHVPITSGNKTKMPRDYFEGLGSKSLIIDWMIANMKPGEIFKCIQRGSLSAEDVQQAQDILGEAPSSSVSTINNVVGSFSPSKLDQMVRIITKEEIIAAVNATRNPDKKKEKIIGICKRAGIKKYSLKTGKKGLKIVDEDGEVVDDIHEVLEECAIQEVKRLKKILKIQSISQSFKNMSKQELINYGGGNTQLPYSLMTFVKKYFPLIKKYENRNGLLYASIPSVREDDVLYYYKVDDVLGKDLEKLDNKVQQGTVSFGKKRFTLKKYTLKSLQKDLKLLK